MGVCQPPGRLVGDSERKNMEPLPPGFLPGAARRAGRAEHGAAAVRAARAGAGASARGGALHGGGAGAGQRVPVPEDGPAAEAAGDDDAVRSRGRGEGVRERGEGATPVQADAIDSHRDALTPTRG